MDEWRTTTECLIRNLWHTMSILVVDVNCASDEAVRVTVEETLIDGPVC